MKPYKPSNIAPQSGISTLAITSILTGLITGGLVSLVSQFFYLIILFPIGMGFVGGIATSTAITKGKIRNPILGASFAALTGIITYGSMNFFDYLHFRQLAAQEITAQDPTASISQAEIDRTIDSVLKQETGADGLIGFIKISAKQGVEITKAGSSSGGIKLNEEFTWFYWLVELAIIEYMAVSMALAAASEPFCEDANEWYGEPVWSGCVPLEAKDNFLNLLNEDRFMPAGELAVSQLELPLPRLDVYLSSCASSQFSDLVFSVKQVSQDKKGNVDLKQLVTGMVSHRQKIDFMQPIELKAESIEQAEAKLPAENPDLENT